MAIIPTGMGQAKDNRNISARTQPGYSGIDVDIYAPESVP
jgi:hypothetical protein